MAVSIKKAGKENAQQIRQVTTHADVTKKWRKDVVKWYPKLHQRTYFVPPVLMKRLNLDSDQVADRSVAIPKPPVTISHKGCGQVDTSLELDSLAQQHIMHCLKVFAEKTNEVMFVLSQLLFSSYLAEPCFAAATKRLPRPVDLKKRNQNRGDFDFLFIHRHYGLLAAEVKSVGTLFTGEPSLQTQEDAVLAKKVQQAVKQLNKSDDVLKHLTGDLPQRPRVTKTLMLPNVTSAQLQRVLNSKPAIKQDLCKCLGIASSEDPSKLCITSDQVSDRRHFWEVSDDVMKKMTQWWEELMAKKGKDPNMSKNLYEELVARFAGPATTVEVFCPSLMSSASKVVRSEGEGVSETAERFMEFVLYEGQLVILSSDEALVYLSGPPGTGKSVVLLLQAEKWLKAGKDVHIFSMFSESTGASLFLKHSLLAKYPEKTKKVHYHCCHYWSPEDKDMIKTLAASAQDSELYIICDEAKGTEFLGFVEELQSHVTKLHLWAARIFHNFIPPGFLHFALNMPLRSPGAVTREIEKCRYMTELGQVKTYQVELPLHTDGPLPRELRHQGTGHDNDVIPLDCQTCGLNLASVLKELHVGEASAGTCKAGGPRPLQFRDVFVLTLATLSDSSGLVQGLRQAGVPVTYMAEYDVATMTQVVTMTGPDAVLATDCRNVSGLERKIVVWIQSDKTDSLTEHTGKLQGYSRTSAQLITVSMVKEEVPLADAFPEAVQATASIKAQETLDSEDSAPSVRFDLDRLLDIANGCITQDTVHEANCLLDVKIISSNGEEMHTFFLNFKYNGGSTGRGQWSNPKEVQGTVTMQHGLLHKVMLRQVGLAEISQAISLGQLRFDTRDSAAIYRLEPVMTKIISLYQEQCEGDKASDT
ncbi:uncharacterized protein [Littorina saxatilis]|uniref:uncharacterized protein n=1 Tax=Littorina saxatilis TaxID=31220 RepID=UPI0038B438CB